MEETFSIFSPEVARNMVCELGQLVVDCFVSFQTLVYGCLSDVNFLHCERENISEALRYSACSQQFNDLLVVFSDA